MTRSRCVSLKPMGLPPHDDLIKYSAMRRKLGTYFAKSDLEWLQRQQALYANAPGLTPQDLKAFAAGGGFSMSKLMPQILAQDLRATVDRLDTRFCVIQGSEDAFTPLAPARLFFDHVQAPAKHLEVIQGAGHFAAMTRTPEFLSAMTRCRAR